MPINRMREARPAKLARRRPTRIAVSRADNASYDRNPGSEVVVLSRFGLNRKGVGDGKTPGDVIE